MTTVTRLLALALGGGLSMPVQAQRPALADTPPNAPLVFDDVTVVDVEEGKLLSGQRVVIVGDRIAAAGKHSDVTMPAGARIVDGRGKYLIPGLWDMHVHPYRLTHLVYPILLANGVTGIRDASSMIPLDTLRFWHREILTGARVGPPRQLLSGASLDEEPSCTGAHICIAQGDTAGLERVIDSLVKAGADMIKPYFLSEAMYAAAAAKARRAGVLFGGHTPMPAEQASTLGASIVDHWDYSDGKISQDCWKQQATVERCQAIADRFRQNGTWWTPTFIRMRRPATMPAGTVDAWARSAHIPGPLASFGAKFWNGVSGPESGPGTSNDTSRAIDPADSARVPARGALAIAQRVGLPMLAATDMSGEFFEFTQFPQITKPMNDVAPGFSLHAELAIFVAEGLTPLSALQAATLNPAKLLRGTDSLGTVARGKLADLVLLDADPLADIANTKAIRAVVANGHYFDRAALDAILARAQADAKSILAAPARDVEPQEP